MSIRDLAIEPLEIYSATFLGRRKTPLPDGAPDARPPRAVLDRLLSEALQSPPCHVSFSGGRDSSAILAEATRVARRDGLPDPVPLTARYPTHADAQENDWQELVVRHLGLRDWVVFDVDTQLDALGDAARDVVLRHGVTGIPAAHSMLLFARRAASGTLLTGTGGDEVFSAWGHRRLSLGAQLRASPRRRAHRVFAAWAQPRRIRHARTRRQTADIGAPWLTAAAREEVARRWRAAAPFERSWREGLRNMLESRGYEVVRAVLEAYAADGGVRLAQPFYDPAFVRAYARCGPRLGPISRTSALEELFGDVLPRAVLHRTTKATFNGVLMGPQAAAFARSWSGSGVDRELVDPEILSTMWSSDFPDGRTLPSMQLAWLATYPPPSPA